MSSLLNLPLGEKLVKFLAEKGDYLHKSRMNLGLIGSQLGAERKKAQKPGEIVVMITPMPK